VDRADGAGLSAAVIGHLALLAMLTLTIAHRKPPAVPRADVMDVQLVDAIGLTSSAPAPAAEQPRQVEAPELGPPVDAVAPPPSLTPPAPQPPAPKPPAPVAKDVIAELAKPAPAKPQPQPSKQLLPDLLKDLRTTARTESERDASRERAAGARIGPDFLKGVIGASPAKGAAAPRASLAGPQLNGLAATIKRQVQPCYDLGALGGTSAMQITTVLQLRFDPDGSIAGTPQLVEQRGVNAGNRAYAKQMEEVSRRAVLRCAPLKLPAELYAGGWENITMGFIPGQMQ